VKGVEFDQEKFHDFIFAQGLLPPDLMRKAVIEEIRADAEVVTSGY
jgi:hypothetical protein